MAQKQYTRGTITLVFDDGYRETFDHVLPLLKQYGFRAVFAVPVNPETVSRSEHSTIVPLPRWKEACTAHGHELAAHGVSHRPFTSLSSEELTQELRDSQQATGATTLVYPGGAMNADVKNATARFFRAARTTAWGIESLPPHDPLALRTLNATQNNFRWWKYNPRELFVILGDRWVIETFHRVTDHPRDLHDVSLHDFRWHLQFLSRLPLWVATIREMISPP